MSLHQILCIWAIGALVAAELRAGDWPQILGAHRNGIAVNEKPLKPWSKTGPARLWTIPVGSGFAGPAVAGNRLVVFHRSEQAERVECLDAATGKQLWATEFPATYRGGVNPDNGPRCVPLIHQGHIFLFGAAGNLHCVRREDGAKVWSRDTYSDYDGDEGYFGAGSSPILVGDHLLVNVGGRGAGIVAFDPSTGETRWKATDDRASYSSPAAALLEGNPHAIFVTRLHCVALNSANGEVKFRFPFGKTGPTVNGAAPLVIGNQLFLSSSYNVGARLVPLNAPDNEVWENDDTMSSQYTTSIHREGYLYGIHGREDFGNGELRCVELQTGKVQWSVPGFGTGHLIGIGDQLLILTTKGNLVLAKADPQRYNELARSVVSQAVTRSMPALSNGRVYFREDEAPKARLYCLDVGAGS